MTRLEVSCNRRLPAAKPGTICRPLRLRLRRPMESSILRSNAREVLNATRNSERSWTTRASRTSTSRSPRPSSRVRKVSRWFGREGWGLSKAAPGEHFFSCIIFLFLMYPVDEKYKFDGDYPILRCLVARRMIHLCGRGVRDWGVLLVGLTDFTPLTHATSCDRARAYSGRTSCLTYTQCEKYIPFQTTVVTARFGFSKYKTVP